jgi:homoserine O-acetyltransferase
VFFISKVTQRCDPGAIRDFLYWFESSYDYNPAAQLDKIKAKLLTVNFADDELNPPELGVMEREAPKVKNGRFVLVPAGEKTRGHQSPTQAEELCERSAGCGE